MNLLRLPMNVTRYLMLNHIYITTRILQKVLLSTTSSVFYTPVMFVVLD